MKCGDGGDEDDNGEVGERLSSGKIRAEDGYGEGDEGEGVVGNDWGGDDEVKDSKGREEGDKEHGDNPEDTKGHRMGGCLKALLVDDEDGEVRERKKARWQGGSFFSTFFFFF